MQRADRLLQGWTISCQLLRPEAHAGQTWPPLRATEPHVGLKLLTKPELLHQVEEMLSLRVKGCSRDVPEVFPLGVVRPTPTMLLSNIVKELPNSLFSNETGRVEERITGDLVRWQMSSLILLHLVSRARSALSQAFQDFARLTCGTLNDILI